MNIIPIIKKEIKHIIRNRKSAIMLFLFPLILMLILGGAFSKSFNNSAVFKNIDVLYLDTVLSKQQPSFQGFLKTGASIGIRFHKVRSLQQGIDNIRSDNYAAFIYNSQQEINLYKNNRLIFEANLVETTLNSFLQHNNALIAISAVNPALTTKLGRDSKKQTLINETSLNRKRKPRAIDYYAVTVLTMIIMYSSYNAVYAVKREQLNHTANRLLASPVSNSAILIGKSLGTLGVTIFQILIIFLASKYLFKVYWGNELDIDIIAILLISEAIMSVSIGVGLAFVIGNHITISGLLNIGIPIFTFLGGGYLPIEQFGKYFMQFANLSPLRWINKAILEVIYSHDFSCVIPSILINLGIAIIFTGITSYYTRKGAFLN